MARRWNIDTLLGSIRSIKGLAQSPSLLPPLLSSPVLYFSSFLTPLSPQNSSTSSNAFFLFHCHSLPPPFCFSGARRCCWYVQYMITSSLLNILSDSSDAVPSMHSRWRRSARSIRHSCSQRDHRRVYTGSARHPRLSDCIRRRHKQDQLHVNILILSLQL